KELSVHLQPIFDIDSKKIVSSVAHVRWHHQAYNSRDTQRFIAAAKSGSLSKPLHDWLLENSLAIATQWNNEALNYTSIRVKLVPAQLEKEGITQFIKNLCNIYQFDPKRLILEFNEQTLIEHSNVVMLELKKLKSIGATSVLDKLANAYIDVNNVKALGIDHIMKKAISVESKDLDGTTTLCSQRLINVIKSCNIYPQQQDWLATCVLISSESLIDDDKQYQLVCSSLNNPNFVELAASMQQFVTTAQPIGENTKSPSDQA
ncbi:MAG: EAL domain-containing protein, partial [Psychrobium sp.]|nr:EAL domain-containing protein [Psychrobium sp.]